jgi:outer membrane protein assembly factor BamB
MVRSKPLVYANLIFIGDDGGTLSAVDPGTGQVVWSYRTGGAITAGPAGYGDMLYAGSLDRRLHAFKVNLPESPSVEGGAKDGS